MTYITKAVKKGSIQRIPNIALFILISYNLFASSIIATSLVAKTIRPSLNYYIMYINRKSNLWLTIRILSYHAFCKLFLGRHRINFLLK